MTALRIPLITAFVTCALLAPSLAGQEKTPEKEPARPPLLGRLKSPERIWSGPSENFRVLKEAPAGTLLEIIGEKGNYYRVKVPGGFPLYINKEFISVGEDMVGTVTGDHVFLRSIPSTKGDYPVTKVDRGRKLLVWGVEGNWVRVTSPPEAFAYAPKESVEKVPAAPAVIDELETMRGKAHKDWEDHVSALVGKREMEEKEKELKSRFDALEKKAAGGFAGCDLGETRKTYEALAKETDDGPLRGLARARIEQIDSIVARKRLEKELAERDKRMRAREEEMRRDLRKLEERKKAAAAPEKKKSPPPGSSAPPRKGGRVNVLGRVDASGAGGAVVLRGGPTRDTILYRISCPDRRYALEDFQGLRILVKGTVAAMPPGEAPRIVVERIEILR